MRKFAEPTRVVNFILSVNMLDRIEDAIALGYARDRTDLVRRAIDKYLSTIFQTDQNKEKTDAKANETVVNVQ